MVKTEPNFNIQQHLGSSVSALSQQSAAENSQQSADQHDVVVELQHFVTASAESTTAAQIILVRHNNRVVMWILMIQNNLYVNNHPVVLSNTPLIKDFLGQQEQKPKEENIAT